MNIRNQYPINTFSGTTQDELVEFIEALVEQEKVEAYKKGYIDAGISQLGPTTLH